MGYTSIGSYRGELPIWTDSYDGYLGEYFL